MKSSRCGCVHAACMSLCAHNSGCAALSCLPLCLWFLCCGAWITPGISRILAAPVDGTEMTVPIMYSSALTPRYFPDLKWHKQQITRVRQQGKKSHITVEIRLKKLFFSCVGVFNPNMEICLSWPSLGWIRRLQTAILCSWENNNYWYAVYRTQLTSMSAIVVLEMFLCLWGFLHILHKDCKGFNTHNINHQDGRTLRDILP